MAKQTFTTGQVLTAAQMISLQQTAMGGGSPSTKTASYVLVAADAGTVIQMNSASATTITVNTSLFSAGDSVQIQNIGSGTTTITAGTATVNSAGSLAVTQYDGGFLYFTSTSSAIWFDYTQPGTSSPLTTKGDLYTRTSSADARLPVGTNGQTLVADSSEATGLKWATPAAGGKVLQVVQATTSTPANLSTTSFTDTNITATITPTSATSKVLVMVSGSIRCLRTIEPTVVNKARLVRGASAVHTRDNVLFLEARLSTANSRLDMVVPFTFNYLDDPATTSATTYKIQGAQVSASGNLDFQFDNSPTTIILMEIGA